MADDKVPMRGPKDCAPTISHAGEIIREVKGVFSVPREAVDTLIRHGFQVIERKL